MLLEQLPIVFTRSPKGALENFRLHDEFNWDSFIVLIQIIVFLSLLAWVIHRLFGHRFNKNPQYSRQPLKYKKIVVDETNVRQNVRVPLKREIVFDSAHFPRGQKILPESAQTIDISQRGLAFVSTLEFPAGTDVNFKIMESSVMATVPLMGTVVAGRLWEGREQEGPPLYLTSLNLKNLGEKGKSLISRLVAEGERELLARQKEKRVKPW